jgi:hypothetical protein
LPGRSDEQFVHGQASWATDRELRDFCDVVGRHLHLAVQPRGTFLGSGVGDVRWQLGCNRARLDDHDSDLRLQLLTERFRSSVHAPFRRGIRGVPGAGSPPRHRGDLDEITAAIPEPPEKDLGCRHRAEQIDLDHLSVLVPLFGGEGPEQHDACVV